MSEIHEDLPEEAVAADQGAASATAPEAMPEADSAAAAPVPQLPGRTLRAAREAGGLAIFEVAQSLKFSPRQVEALEADDYAALPQGATFLRGFVRGYAKLLKLDPLPLLGMLDARAPAALPDVREPQNMGIAATPIVAGRRSSRPMLVGAAVLALLALGMGVWHFLGSPIPAAALKTAPAAEVSSGSEVTTVRPPDVRIEEAPAAAAGEPPAPVVLPADMRQLIFVFNDKSWVEVKDATQRILFSGENQAGARQVIAGKPPFQLVIGNAVKVDLQYEDRQIDLKPHIRAEVARLTLE